MGSPDASYIHEIVKTLFMVLLLGTAALLIGKRTRISYVPIFIILGIIFGPVLHVINRDIARHLFDYVRVFGLVIILFAEGHTLRWAILKKHLTTIGTLDTLSLVVTAIIAGLAFSYVFHLPFLAGFLYGAIISATDPATLIPLFHQYRVREDIKTILVTESIFNDPLGIVLTSVAVALVLPQAPSAKFLEMFAKYMPIYGAATVYFLYEMFISIALGAAFGYIGYWIIRGLKFDKSDEIFLFSLGLAFIGFYTGELIHASGYLVATTIGIVLGNHHVFFKEPPEVWGRMRSVIDTEVHFNEILAIFSIVSIFVLLGASVNLTILEQTFIYAAIVALVVIFIARPVAALPIIPVGKWSWKEYLFMSLEGPRGVVPSALAPLPLSLGLAYHVPQLIKWGEIILSTTLVTVLLSIIIETLWVPYLRRTLLSESGEETQQPAVEEATA